VNSDHEAEHSEGSYVPVETLEAAELRKMLELECLPLHDKIDETS
jgi:hypothetical protein